MKKEYFIFRLILFTYNMLNTAYQLIQNVGKYILIFLTTDFGTNVSKKKRQ